MVHEIEIHLLNYYVMRDDRGLSFEVNYIETSISSLKIEMRNSLSIDLFLYIIKF